MNSDVVVKLEHITQKFGAVTALNDVSIDIRRNRIVSIIGENGAGKSTLCKIITGLYSSPTSGKVYLDGTPVSFKSPKDSMLKGICMVYQERNVVPMLNGAQNIFLNFEPGRGDYINEKLIMEKAREMERKLNVSIPLDVPVEKLGVGEQQMIEIIRALVHDPKVLILDEPTASLSKAEIRPFIDFLKNLKNTSDISIIYISHKIEEVFEISDDIVVLTDGECRLCATIDAVTREQCIRAMLRDDKSLRAIEIPEWDHSNDEIVLECKYGRYDNKEHELGMYVRRHEVVGFYGLVGSGRTEFVEYLYGLRKASFREFKFAGETIHKCTPAMMIEKGMVLTPELRKYGIFPTLKISENIINFFLKKRLSNRWGFVNFKAGNKLSLDILKKNFVKYNNLNQPISELSGGNIQKVIIGRSVEVEGIKLLITDEPTTGMDIGAKHDVYLKLRSLADKDNIGVIFISSELEELMLTCDRIYIFAEGSIVQCFERKDFDKAMIVEAAIRRVKHDE